MLADISRFRAAREVGVPVLHVFDSDEWEFLTHTLFDEDEQVLESFDPAGLATRVVIIYRILLCRKIRPYAASILQDIADYFGRDSLLVVWNHDEVLNSDEIDAIGLEQQAMPEVLVRSTEQSRFDRQPGKYDPPEELCAFPSDQAEVEAMLRAYFGPRGNGDL